MNEIVSWMLWFSFLLLLLLLFIVVFVMVDVVVGVLVGLCYFTSDCFLLLLIHMMSD